MPSTFTDLLKLEIQADGENESLWDDIYNDVLHKIEYAIAGRIELLLTSADVILNNDDGGEETPATAMILDLSGNLTDDINIIAPNRSKIYLIHNACTPTATEVVNIKTATGAALEIPAGESRLVWCDGNNVFRMAVVEGGAEEKGTFTATLTGMTASTQPTVRYSKTGDRVTLHSLGLLGTSNSAAMKMTGLPAAIIPAAQSIVICSLINAGEAEVGAAVVKTNGEIEFWIAPTLNDALVSNGFQASGAKGIGVNASAGGWSITYKL